ncbi:MAG: hypothetical protein V4732_02715 [Pseudomonadota bacterium]
MKEDLFEILRDELCLASISQALLIPTAPKASFFIKCLFNPISLQLFVSYIKDKFDKGHFRFIPYPSPASYGLHNDELGLALSYLFRNSLEVLLNLKLKPSYCYYSFYPENAVLPPHRDRDECDLTLAIYLHDSYQFESERTLLCLNNGMPDGAEIRGTFGDATIFFGREVQHWRTPPEATPGQVMTAMFHYSIK